MANKRKNESKFSTIDQVKKRLHEGGEAVPAVKFLNVEVSEDKGPGGEDDNTLQFAISSIAVDRDGDTIDPMGWKLDNYLKNPVVLWAHDGHTPPVARSLATWIEDGKLKSRAQFTPKDLSEFGHMVYRMYKEKYLNATSVGFMPIKWVEAGDRSGWYPMDFKEQELLEYSAVPVPSNPEALVEARSKSGIDTLPLLDWAGRTLDMANGETGLWIPRKTIEDVHSILKKDNGKDKFYSIPGVPAMLDNPEMKAAAEELIEQMGLSEEVIEIITDNKESDVFVKMNNGRSLTLPYSYLEEIGKEGGSIYTSGGSVFMSAKLFGDLLQAKAGRTLSAANETKIKGAVESIGKALESLNDVLAQLGEAAEDLDGDDEKNISPPDDTNGKKSDILLEKTLDKLDELISKLNPQAKAPDVEPEELSLSIEDEEETVFEIADDEKSNDDEAELEVDTDTLKTMLMDAFKDAANDVRRSLTGRID